MKALLAVAIVIALAGCSDPQPAFDGDAAWDFVDAIVYDGDSLRQRAPGDAGHEDAADWLLGQMAVAGWTTQRIDFNGSDYLALDRSTVARWQTCPDEDLQQLPGLQFHNLVARLDGPVGAPTFALAAHWDAKEDASDGGRMPAANDGASGVGLLLQLQRELMERDLAFPFALEVVFFDGEDGFEDCHPLAGSLYHAQVTRGIDRLLLLDMVGDPDARFLRETNSLQGDPVLMELLWEYGAAHGLADQFTQKSGPITDDHIPFIQQGVPAADLIDAARSGTFPPYWHTSEDTPDKVDPDMLAAIGDVVLAVMADERFLAGFA